MSLNRDKKLEAAGYQFYGSFDSYKEAKKEAATFRKLGYYARAYHSAAGLVRGWDMGGELWVKEKGEGK